MDFILDLPVQVYKVPAGEHFSVGDLCDGKKFLGQSFRREKKQDFSVIFKVWPRYFDEPANGWTPAHM